MSLLPSSEVIVELDKTQQAKDAITKVFASPDSSIEDLKDILQHTQRLIYITKQDLKRLEFIGNMEKTVQERKNES